ncbi:MAG: tetratricopeptide repeat protein, partial [Chitinophagales bacterium]|nr:tetratricopeptide repeat protein [Chitinophagales bacterium]MDW8419545.1 tetratricopeptide repeat protein [Chitinophagales bacterium]
DLFEKNFGLDEQVIEEKKNLYLRLNRFQDAVNEVKKLQEAFPGETEYLLQEAELYRANKMREKAIEVYKKILQYEPDNPQAQLGLTALQMTDAGKEQNYENVRQIFENDKVGIDTKISILMLSYVQNSRRDSARIREALELGEILTRVHPDDAKAHAMKGDLYYMNEQDDKALAAYLRALELNKDVVQVWQNVILIYNSKRDWNKSLQMATEAIELFPNHAILYLFKGGAEFQLKQYEKALKSFLKGEKMSNDNTKLRAQFLSNLGDVYHNLNRHAESDSAYEKSLKLDGDNPYVLNNYSYYLSLRKHNLERAKQMSAYSNQLEPNNSSFLDTYAWILFQMKDYKGAREWQEKALKADKENSATLLEHYGDILFMLGEKNEALNYWKKAKDAGSDSDTLDRKIAEQRYIE